MNVLHDALALKLLLALFDFRTVLVLARESALLDV